MISQCICGEKYNRPAEYESLKLAHSRAGVIVSSYRSDDASAFFAEIMSGLSTFRVFRSCLDPCRNPPQ